jgi:hypothetical protein
MDSPQLGSLKPYQHLTADWHVIGQAVRPPLAAQCENSKELFSRFLIFYPLNRNGPSFDFLSIEFWDSEKIPRAKLGASPKQGPPFLSLLPSAITTRSQRIR